MPLRFRCFKPLFSCFLIVRGNDLHFDDDSYLRSEYNPTRIHTVIPGCGLSWLCTKTILTMSLRVASPALALYPRASQKSWRIVVNQYIYIYKCTYVCINVFVYTLHIFTIHFAIAILISFIIYKWQRKGYSFYSYWRWLIHWHLFCFLVYLNNIYDRPLWYKHVLIKKTYFFLLLKRQHFWCPLIHKFISDGMVFPRWLDMSTAHQHLKSPRSLSPVHSPTPPWLPKGHGHGHRWSAKIPFRSISISPPIPEIRLFQTLTLKLEGQDHGYGQRNIIETEISFWRNCCQCLRQQIYSASNDADPSKCHFCFRNQRMIVLLHIQSGTTLKTKTYMSLSWRVNAVKTIFAECKDEFEYVLYFSISPFRWERSIYMVYCLVVLDAPVSWMVYNHVYSFYILSRWVCFTGFSCMIWWDSLLWLSCFDIWRGRGCWCVIYVVFILLV